MTMLAGTSHRARRVERCYFFAAGKKRGNKSRKFRFAAAAFVASPFAASICPVCAAKTALSHCRSGMSETAGRMKAVDILRSISGERFSQLVMTLP